MARIYRENIGKFAVSGKTLRDRSTIKVYCKSTLSEEEEPHPLVYPDHHLYKLSTKTPFFSLYPPALLPPPPPTKPLPHIHKPNQHRHLNQRPHRRRQRLPTASPIRRDSHRNRQLKVVARRREALRTRNSVGKPEPVAHKRSGEERDGEVDDQRGADAEHGGDLVHDVRALAGEEDDDGVEEANEGEGRERPDDVALVPVWTEEVAEGEAGEDCGSERYA